MIFKTIKTQQEAERKKGKEKDASLVSLWSPPQRPNADLAAVQGTCRSHQRLMQPN